MKTGITNEWVEQREGKSYEEAKEKALVEHMTDMTLALIYGIDRLKIEQSNMEGEDVQ